MVPLEPLRGGVRMRVEAAFGHPGAGGAMLTT